MNEPAATEADNAALLKEDFHNLLFGVRRSVRYHVRRRSFFETLNTLSTVAALIFGSATIAALLGPDKTWLVLTVAALVTITSAINLVIGSTRKAQLHWDLARKFISLEKQMIASEATLTRDKLAELTASRIDLEADEPPILRVLDTMCHNELMRAMGYPESEFIKVGRFQRLCSQLFDWREHAVIPRAQNEVAKTAQ